MSNCLRLVVLDSNLCTIDSQCLFHYLNSNQHFFGIFHHNSVVRSQIWLTLNCVYDKKFCFLVIWNHIFDMCRECSTSKSYNTSVFYSLDYFFGIQFYFTNYRIACIYSLIPFILLFYINIECRFFITVEIGRHIDFGNRSCVRRVCIGTNESLSLC